jgi:hypothetical protein
MLNLHKFGRNCLVILAISSLNTTLVENPVQASFGYACSTSKFYVDVTTNSQGQLVYTAFEGHYDNRPHRDPDLVLYNGRIVSQKKMIGMEAGYTTVVRWGAAGGFIYQISKAEEPGGDEGELLVKQKGKVLYRLQCASDIP